MLHRKEALYLDRNKLDQASLTAQRLEVRRLSGRQVCGGHTYAHAPWRTHPSPLARAALAGARCRPVRVHCDRHCHVAVGLPLGRRRRASSVGRPGAVVRCSTRNNSCLALRQHTSVRQWAAAQVHVRGQMGTGNKTLEEVVPSAKRAKMDGGSVGLAVPVDAASSMRKSISGDNLLTEVHGEVDTADTRFFSKDVEGEHRSLWHDLPLFELDHAGKPTGALNFVCEIPKWTRKKFEIATKEALNPIKQDEKKGELRSFKKGDIYFNYGCFPRTWEDPQFVHPEVGVGGDNDPLDVCEIGLRQIETGKVRPVKVLGVLCMIDEGEADWKVVAIDRTDPWAEQLNDIDDLDRLLPGLLDSIREWFRTYKIPDGKPANKFALGEKFMSRSYAMGVVHETHQAWASLVRGAVEEESAKSRAPLPEAPTTPQIQGMKRSTLKRNLSVPSLEALEYVEHSLLSDEKALQEALSAAGRSTN